MVEQLRPLSRVMRFPDPLHPIFSNPSVIGSRANLMRSMPKDVDTSQETEALPSTPSSSRLVDPKLEETKEDGSRGERGS